MCNIIYLCRSVLISLSLSIYLSIYVSQSVSIYLSIYVSQYVCMYVCMSVCMYLSQSVSIYLSIYLSICFSYARQRSIPTTKLPFSEHPFSSDQDTVLYRATLSTDQETPFPRTPVLKRTRYGPLQGNTLYRPRKSFSQNIRQRSLPTTKLPFSEHPFSSDQDTVLFTATLSTDHETPFLRTPGNALYRPGNSLSQNIRSQATKIRSSSGQRSLPTTNLPFSEHPIPAGALYEHISQRQLTHSPKPFDQVDSPKPFDQVDSPKPFDQVDSPKPFDQVDSPKPFDQVDSPKPFDQVDSPKPFDQVDSPKPFHQCVDFSYSYFFTVAVD
ncbi:unnamed protein product [Acanthosepion pharaonis]|uniref:Uncharacterized protein n=1 Tax=Acanthosepion pharaonis TaxID=158019 RepID=A0A812C2T3_ACAPH|nr:unnamed protein product [Sepia pharaonis]